LEKGQENQKLAEAVNEIKNHHLTTSIIGQKFAALKVGTIKYEEVTVNFTPVNLVVQVYLRQVEGRWRLLPGGS